MQISGFSNQPRYPYPGFSGHPVAPTPENIHFSILPPLVRNQLNFLQTHGFSNIEDILANTLEMIMAMYQVERTAYARYGKKADIALYWAPPNLAPNISLPETARKIDLTYKGPLIDKTAPPDRLEHLESRFFKLAPQAQQDFEHFKKRLALKHRQKPHQEEVAIYTLISIFCRLQEAKIKHPDYQPVILHIRPRRHNTPLILGTAYFQPNLPTEEYKVY